MTDDYLFDPTASPDPEIERLERALAPFRHRPRGASPRRRLPWRAAGGGAVAAAAACVAAFLWLDHGASDTPSPYRLDGAVDVARVFTAAGRLRARDEGLATGDRIVLGDGARARLSIGSIGSVLLEASTSLRIEERTDVARPAAGEEPEAFALYLERGTVAASIFAAPRVFQVGTPSGIAVDLGCIYTTTVTADDRTLLAVVSGFVSFETPARHVFVPAGAECEALPGVGPLTPTWQDAAAEYKAAVRRLDVEATPPPEALEVVARSSDERATLTLWHLLEHRAFAVKKTALDVLVSAGRVPDAIAVEALAAGDAAALTALRKSFDWSW